MVNVSLMPFTEIFLYMSGDTRLATHGWQNIKTYAVRGWRRRGGSDMSEQGRGGQPKAGKKFLRKITDALPVFRVYVCRFQQHPASVEVGYQRYSQSTCLVHKKKPMMVFL